jgi:hypothetical protein
MTATPEHPTLRSRTVGCLHPADDNSITVDHVYLPEGSHECSEPGCVRPAHDPGMVGLIMSEGDNAVSALLEPEEALILAERLTRAASLVLESGEDPADIEREAAKYTATA